MQKKDELIFLINQCQSRKKELWRQGIRYDIYSFHRPIEPCMITKFEVINNCLLPDDYKYFLSNIGDGGTGPFGNMYSLSETEKLYNSPKKKASIKLDGYLFDKQIWGNYVNAYNNSDLNIAELIWNEFSSNFVIIGFKEECFDYAIALNGKEKNKVIYIPHEVRNDLPPYSTGLFWGEWVYGFYEAVYRGEDINGYAIKDESYYNKLMHII